MPRQPGGVTTDLTAIMARIDAVLTRGGADERPTPLTPLDKAAAAAGASAPLAFARDAGFRGAAGEVAHAPLARGGMHAYFGLGDKALAAEFGAAPTRLVADRLYALEGVQPASAEAEAAALAFALGAYRFEAYAPAKRKPARLAIDGLLDAAAAARVRATALGVYLARDLVNTPTSDLGPDGLEAAARAVARRFGAELHVTVGDMLLVENFPMIHAVGRAGAEPPRLLDLRWSGSRAPADARAIVLVGKGVCFDTGGLDIKPSASMLLMKKDMGGAAAALAVAAILMAEDAPLKIRVLIPTVENSISSNAFRPGDVLDSRKGLTVEIGNTDAEGRLILADALAYASEAEPALIIDLATLTGAARVALGPDIAPFYTGSDALAADFARAAAATDEPVWRMPLHDAYDADLSSKIADLNNVSAGGHAGSITAALFLRRFVAKPETWLHLDIFAWNPSAKPGRPEGGEATAARALAAMLRAKAAE